MVGPRHVPADLRQGFLMNGSGLPTLQRILGHSSLEIVKGYLNLNTQDLLVQHRRYSPVDCLAVP